VRRTLIAAVAIGGLSAAALSGCTEQTEPTQEAGRPVQQPPVELTVDEPMADPVRIGVIATLSSDPGQGADALLPAEGAQVAAYRLDLGGQPVTLEVADDQGTAEGAREAVEQLVNARVSGIVAATTGDHVVPALADAAAADTPVLLPYLRTDAELPEGAWLTGPTAEAVGSVLADAMAEDDLADPFVITADGVPTTGIDAAAQVDHDGTDTDALVGRLRRAARSGDVDSAVIAASAPTQAQIVSRLQGSVSELPLVLTPEALSPAFAEQLQDANGTTAAQFVTAGVDASDTATLTTGERADAVASYFAALRLLSQTEALDLFDSVPFAEVATGADTASHDAVVALVTAAVEAGSSEPSDVLAAIEGLQVDAADGLAGPALDFSSARALPADAVVELNATSQDPGVRPSGDAAALYWFAVPDKTG
jgi:ABC-type branched-subunit amino acid transport system substrate-binding protein